MGNVISKVGEVHMAARKPTAKKAGAKKTAPQDGSKRDGADAAVESYFAQQPPDKRALLAKLRALVEKSAPNAVPSIKWGVPIYAQNGKNVCALATFKDHIGLNFFAPPSALADPKKKLEGEGKTSRMLKVRSAADIDGPSITRWVRVAVAANS
jgi:hypothetical protein